MSAPVLEIEHLRVVYRTARGDAGAVDDVSLSLRAGTALGLVGESGCGKSTIAKAILGILPPNGRIAGGAIRYRGQDLALLSADAFRQLRWRDIALVPQSAINGFDPVYTIGQQLDEALRAHAAMPARARRARMAELFALVGLEPSRLADYPHQFSGGMRQRAMIAMAMVLDPTLIVADEPTTALDVIVQDQILGRIRELHQRLGKTLLLITHDLGVVAENCDEVAVMYAGKVVEYGPIGLLRAPAHPYTIGLMNAFPDAGELVSIPGGPPSLVSPPTGCRFRERCPLAAPVCAVMPPLVEVAPGHVAACYRVEEARRGALPPNAEAWDPAGVSGPQTP